MESQSLPPTPKSRSHKPRKKARLERPSGWFLVEDVLPRNRKERRARYLSISGSKHLQYRKQRDKKRYRRELFALLRVIAPIVVLGICYVALTGNPVVIPIFVVAGVMAFYGFPIIERLIRQHPPDE